jgi:selenide,water dikinase
MVSGGARACTDVTGFGLLGHLHEMLMASGADAVLALDDVPLLDGAREVTRLGIASSLTPENLRLRRAVEADHAVAAQPAFSLLFDPQTAGGLLAAVPPASAAAVLHDLRTAGYAGAAIIGRATAMREDRPTVIVKTD